MDLERNLPKNTAKTKASDKVKEDSQSPAWVCGVEIQGKMRRFHLLK